MKTRLEKQTCLMNFFRRHSPCLPRWFCCLILASAFCLKAMAQNYSADWHKIAGGGGTSTGGVYSVSSTIGQHDAGGPLIGNTYSLYGGFWSLITVVQTVGLPNLTITHSGASVVVSWANTGNYTLQQNGSPATSSWVNSSYTVTTLNGLNSVTMTPSSGDLFFRLKNP
jgi:hypothetical protein